MKKSSLTTAVLAGLVGVVGFAGSSSAVEINPDGTGQVLIYPYYTARAGQQTYISVVNSTETAQAVKVRFLEGYASKEVLDFNLFLSAYDVWTGTVFKLSDAGQAGDGAAIGTTDKSCTVPTFQNTLTSGLKYQPFSNAYYTNSQFEPDLGPQGADRTNEGYVEMIDMANIGNANGTRTAITHVPTVSGGLAVAGSGVPPGCANDGLLNDITNADLNTIAPTGGLFGGGAIINVHSGVMYAYTADAIDGFTAIPLFTDSGSLDPTLANANTDPNTLEADAYVFQQGGGVVTANYAAGDTIDAVSAVFDASALLNEWVANAAQGQGTDWVVTFPTKRFYVNARTTALPPFAEALDENFDGAACVAVGLNIYDREEGTPGIKKGGPIFSPAPTIQSKVPSLCHEVNIISISDPDNATSILGSELRNGDGTAGLAVNVAPFGTAGWMRLDFVNNTALPVEKHLLSTATNGVVFKGLPATGFAAQQLINADAAPGTMANYGGAYRHRVERNVSCMVGGAVAACQ